MDELYPDRRRFHCGRCGKVAYICSRCDRGQQYCSSTCRSEARRRDVGAAGARYQRTRRGRENHARRQQKYRDRQAARKKVTHHPCRSEATASTVVACGISSTTATTEHSPKVRQPGRHRELTQLRLGEAPDLGIRGAYHAPASATRSHRRESTILPDPRPIQGGSACLSEGGSLLASAETKQRCDFCGHGCKPYVRLDFLRCRRPRRRSRDDPAGGEGGDPASA